MKVVRYVSAEIISYIIFAVGAPLHIKYSGNDPHSGLGANGVLAVLMFGFAAFLSSRSTGSYQRHFEAMAIFVPLSLLGLFIGITTLSAS